MSKRDEVILEGALGLFLRYGVKRTSMNDIARQAGVSRQTLYNAFSNKDEILRAMIRLFTERGLEEIKSGFKTHAGFTARLDILLEQIAVRPFEMLGVSPNAEDIVLGMNATSRDEIDASHEKFKAAIEAFMKDYAPALKRSGMTPRQCADFIHVSATAAKSQAADRKHLDQLLRTLKVMVARCADPSI